MAVHDYAGSDHPLALGPPIDGFIDQPYTGSSSDPSLQRGDGHYEFTVGGARLLACESSCGYDGTGSGAAGCFGTFADHPAFPDVWADDTAQRTPALASAFCGDGDLDFGMNRFDPCQASFLPGMDGAYQALVSGTKGHAWTN